MKKLNRNIFRALLIISFIAVNGLILFGISAVLAFLNSGADRSTMLHNKPKNIDIYLPEFSWTSIENPGRPMEKTTLEQIQEHYLNAWYVRNVAYQTNNPYGIEDFYTDSSRINLYKNIEFNKLNGITIEATTLNHKPKLEFYSADGQLVVLKDEQVIEYQKLYQNNKFILITRDTSTYNVMLLLEDGFWRIRHLVKNKGNVPNDDTEAGESILATRKDTVLLNGNPFVIKGINYYPQANPWNTFGESFDSKIIEADFKLIQNAKLNTIRIFIQYEDFGKAAVKEEKLKKLEDVLNLAEKCSLKVVVTLFDFYGDYSLLNWSLTHRHAEQIVTRFKNHQAIIAWDIKNEPDLDFESRGKENVVDWLSEMITVVKKYDPSHFVTIGWSNPDVAVLLKDKLDLVSFHYYRGINDFESTIQELKKIVHEKPVIVQEFGLSSYKGIWNPFGYSEKKQSEYHKKMQAVFERNTLAFISWTLYDFDEIPVSVAGRLPWRKSKQTRFGFLDRLGKPKPAFDFICY